MKSRFLFIIAAFMISPVVFAQNNFEQKDLVGSWLGKLKVQGIELRLVFNLSFEMNDSIVATMDSPDQGAKGIKMGLVSFEANNLKIDAPLIRGSYVGKMVLADSITGSWNQNGQSFDVSLKKQGTPFSLNRPQEPRPPFNYIIEEVKFKNEKAGHVLAGTLTIPKGEGPFPAVVLISGSGAQNRDEELFGHKPFWVIADYLTKNGIAVLRYDDQGVGQSGGSQLNTTSYDYSFDAEAAVDFLAKDQRIDHKAIGFAGHSEGGLIAPIVMSRNSIPGFFISLAGPAINGKKLLLLQSGALEKALGATEDKIKKDQELNSKLYDILINNNNYDDAMNKVSETFRSLLKKSGKSQEEIEKEISNIKKGVPKEAYNWMHYFLKTDPADFLVKIKCPVLVLNGDKDLQVLSKENLQAYEQIFKQSGLKDYTLIELKNHNHLFQHCKTGLPAEYGTIEESFSPEALEIMGDWIKKRFEK